jgi:hypothetical protein
MATAGTYNITMDQGAQWTLTVVYEDSNGNPIDLTGYTARMQLRKKFDSTTAVLTLATGGQGIVITPLTGTLELTATTAQMLAIEGGIYVYDLELTNAGVVTRLMMGSATVRSEVTKNV